ncbi:UDP-glycosyltransferase 73C6-like [Magnolia sinica]|uniref:UDP-glycosyltransferase 73C6-like n=1 Tax=Magnolia sinica TaxID=86752 RepID=UPI00265A08F4|nr:UDP-glycosyltransferase 73C6-like [Magnolia sinica]
MAAQDPHQLHFIFIPFLAPGHMIPMIDMAGLFAKRGVIATVITTTDNGARFEAVINRAMESNLPFRLVQVRFPSQEVGMPDRIENVDSIVSRESGKGFFDALEMLQQPIEKYLQEHLPRPSCIISDSFFPWTCETAQMFQIPRIVFHGMCCFSLLCIKNVLHYKSHEDVASEFEPIAVPGLPHRIEIPKSQLPESVANNSGFQEISEKARTGDSKSYGVVVNSFNESDNEYVEYYQKATGKKVWTIGPVSLYNKEMLDKTVRGNKTSINEHECLSWLDSRKPKSVVYVCFGSICRLTHSQLIQIGLGLEASNRSFVWVIRDISKPEKIEEWLSDGFDERIKDRGLIIRGWAPQILILSHPAIGGFLTHCGWNSTLEGICAGVPMLAWPLFGEQFLNEKLIVQVLRIGVDLGISRSVAEWYPDEKKEVLVEMEEVTKAVERLMDEGDEGEERRKRARTLGEKARSAMEEGGSSYINMTLLIEDIINQHTERNNTEVSVL